ncbi:ATP-binding protein [Advenella faeciporci]|nr:ATP-binding protein [Advenella faeciporci]
MGLSIALALSSFVMTLFKPTILVNRLIVVKDGRSVIDISFHAGLNVIAGQNSSGKTTVIRFIAYALGSENINFNQVAQMCDDIYLEIAANEAVVTLRRNVSTQLMQPLSIFWGSMLAAMDAGPAMWQLYPFKRSESKESFSQVLFRLFEMPELRSEGGSNITMHQLMRLVYSDQETPPSDLFRHDRFDRAITRAAVGDYLLGIDSTELYDLKLEESSLDKETTAIRASIRTIYSTFGHSGTNISLEFLDEKIQTLASEVSDLQVRLANLSAESHKTSSAKEDNSLREQLNDAHSSLSKLKQQKIALQAEIADSELFLKELEERLSSLEESAVAESYLGTAIFSFCPSCFTKLESADENLSTCTLCKSEIAEDAARSQLARMRNELALQLSESNTIRTQQLRELDSISLEIPSAEMRLKSLEDRFKRNQSHWRSPHQIMMQSISKDIGSKEQEIKNTLELKKLANLLEQLNTKLGQVESQLEWTRGRIEAVSRAQVDRRNIAYLSVADNLKEILKEDLSRQTEFAEANEIDIDFAANRLTIDGQSQFSASSMVFLRHGFHLALLLSSLDNEYFRYPRLLILDGIEDGGMEVERSYNFQNIIANRSNNSDTIHQIIMTTMDVCPELDNEAYLVGRKFTHTEKSIGIS